MGLFTIFCPFALFPSFSLFFPFPPLFSPLFPFSFALFLFECLLDSSPAVFPCLTLQWFARLHSLLFSLLSSIQTRCDTLCFVIIECFPCLSFAYSFILGIFTIFFLLFEPLFCIINAFKLLTRLDSCFSLLSNS